MDCVQCQRSCSTCYKTLKVEIAKLEKQAEVVRKVELKSLIAQVKQTIREQGLTARDLDFMSRAAASSGQAKTGTVRKSALPEYMDAETRKNWAGHGKPPGSRSIRWRRATASAMGANVGQVANAQ